MKPIIKVAYAEDHVGVRQGIVGILNQESNIRVIADASNGKELLAIFSDLQILPDIAMLDIDMPVMNGYETARRIREQFPAVKTIAFSFHRNEFNIIKMIKNGAVGYLIKGVHDVHEICEALEHVMLNGHYYGSVGEEVFQKAQHSELPELNEKETEFLTLCCDGYSNREIGEKMCLNYRSVEYYYETLSKKFGVHNRIKLVAFALKTGIVSINQ